LSIKKLCLLAIDIDISSQKDIWDFSYFKQDEASARKTPGLKQLS
jgi:hypothetical protein